MAIRVTCENCGTKYRVKDESSGRKIRCRICKQTVEVPAVGKSLVIRHAPRTREPTVAKGDLETIDRVSDHIERHLGPISLVYHEICSDLVHIDVHLVPPTSERPWNTLVTSGMSDLPMSVPDGSGGAPFAELLVNLPEDWPLTDADLKDENHYWPVRGLKWLARLPHEYETWLGPWHSVPNGDPPEPFASGTEFCGWLLTPPVSAPDEFEFLSIREGKAVRFLALVPLYGEELDFKVRRGSAELLDRFQKYGIDDIVALGRRNVCRKRLWS